MYLWNKGIGLLLGAAVCLGTACYAVRDCRSVEYPIILMGDSIVANDYVGAELDEMLSEALGETVWNAGFGGSGMCNINVGYYETCGDESLSMEMLAKSIVTGDFLAQKRAIRRISKLDYFEERLNMLAEINFEKTHTLIIEHCINDYAVQIPPETVGKVLKESIELLQGKYPQLRIVVSSPTYCYIVKNEERLYCDTTELGEYVLEEYIWQEQQVCEDTGVIFVDNYHQDVITRETMDAYYLDGLHLNEAGRQFLADNIVKALDR